MEKYLKALKNLLRAVAVLLLLVSLALSSVRELTIQEQEQLAKELGTTKLEVMELNTKLAMKDADIKIKGSEVENIKMLLRQREDELFWSRIYNIAFAGAVILAAL